MPILFFSHSGIFFPPTSRMLSVSGGAVKAKPYRAATRALSAPVLLPAIEYYGRGTRMPPAEAPITDAQPRNPWKPFYHFLRKFSLSVGQSVGQICPAREKALRFSSKSLFFFGVPRGI